MDLTILVNFSQIRQSEISGVVFDDFDEFSPFSLQHAFLDVSPAGRITFVLITALSTALNSNVILWNFRS